MAGLPDYVATSLLAWITGKTAFPALPTAYLALFNTAPTSNSGITGAIEVSSSNYARQQLPSTSWNTPSNSVGSEPSVIPAQVTNSVAIAFPTPTGNWGTVTSFGIFDALTSGNLLYWDYLGNFPWLPASVSSASPAIITSHAHGYNNNDTVVITTKFGGTLPNFNQSNFTGLLTVSGTTVDTLNVNNSGTQVNTSSTGDIQIRKVTAVSVGPGIQINIQVNGITLTSS